MDLTNNLTIFSKILWLWFVTLSFEPFGEILLKNQQLLGIRLSNQLKFLIKLVATMKKYFTFKTQGNIL
jgi:hypothetical protein